MAKLLKAEPKCEVCKKRYADGLLGRMCSICQRRMMFEKLPPEEKKLLIRQTVPERYIEADPGHLTGKLKKIITSDVDTGILLWGETGVGKTYALAALAKKHISEGFLVERIHYEVLCLKLRDTFKPKSKQTEWDIIEPLLNCDALYIEDVGTSKDIGSKETEFSLRTFYVLLDMRLECCKPTFITTNKSVENLTASFDERIGDRLRTFKIIKLGGKSKRKNAT